MPGFLLHEGASVVCAHGGTAVPVAPNPRVRVSGMPVAGQDAQWIVNGCPLPRPDITATWITAASRVRSMGRPVLLSTSQGLCVQSGTPLLVVNTQMRVRGI